MDSVWLLSKWPPMELKASVYVEGLRPTPQAAMRMSAFFFLTKFLNFFFFFFNERGAEFFISF